MNHMYHKMTICAAFKYRHNNTMAQEQFIVFDGEVYLMVSEQPAAHTDSTSAAWSVGFGCMDKCG